MLRDVYRRKQEVMEKPNLKKYSLEEYLTRKNKISIAILCTSCKSTAFLRKIDNTLVYLCSDRYCKKRIITVALRRLVSKTLADRIKINLRSNQKQ